MAVTFLTNEDKTIIDQSIAQLSEEIGASVPVIQTATVGQTVVVKAVDENGKPTEWEAADMGGGDVSWNDLQDRPFGDVVESTTLVENYTAEFTAGKGVTVTLSTASDSSYNKPFKVVWDGVVYENLIAEYGGSAFMEDIVGSDTIWKNPDAEHEYPFLMVGVGYTSTEIIAATEGEHTFSIYQENIATTQIDDKFIPDTVLRIDPNPVKRVLFTGSDDDGWATSSSENAQSYREIAEKANCGYHIVALVNSVVSKYYHMYRWDFNEEYMQFMSIDVEDGMLVRDCFTVNSDDTVTREVQKFTLTPVTETTE